MTNITAMFRTRYAAAVPILMLLVVIAAGCSSVSDEEFERRVQEEVGRQLAEREAKTEAERIRRVVDEVISGLTSTTTPVPPTATPTATYTPTPTFTATYWPTIEDYRLIVVSWWAKQSYDWGGKETTLGYFDQYAATYAASECLANGQLTSRDFREFLDGTFDGGGVRLDSAARTAIKRLIALDQNGIRVQENCMRPFLYPESGAEAALGLGLYKAVTLRSVVSFAREGFVESSEELPGHWFSLTQQPRQSYLAWLCGLSANNRCQLP